MIKCFSWISSSQATVTEAVILVITSRTGLSTWASRVKDQDSHGKWVTTLLKICYRKLHVLFRIQKWKRIKFIISQNHDSTFYRLEGCQCRYMFLRCQNKTCVWCAEEVVEDFSCNVRHDDVLIEFIEITLKSRESRAWNNLIEKHHPEHLLIIGSL